NVLGSPFLALLTDRFAIPWAINCEKSEWAMAVNTRAFSLCVAIALSVSCGSSRNKADGAKAVADAIRQQIERYAATLAGSDIALASQVWRTSAEVSFAVRRETEQ